MFIKILTKEYKGEKYYYARLVENKRIDGKVVQTVKANLGAVTGGVDSIFEGSLC